MSFESPVSILFNTDGVELSVSESQAITSTQPGFVIFGSGSTGFEYLRLSDNGELFVTGTIDASFAPNTPVSQGNPGGISDAWYVTITDGTQPLGVNASAPLFVSGAVDIPNTVTVTGSVEITSIASPVTTRPIACANTTVTGFGASTTNVTVLPANSSRCGAVFYMDGKADAYLKLGAGATSTSFTVKLGKNSYYELPERYTGQIDVVFSKNDAGDVLRITEISE